MLNVQSESLFGDTTGASDVTISPEKTRDSSYCTDLSILEYLTVHTIEKLKSVRIKEFRYRLRGPGK